MQAFPALTCDTFLLAEEPELIHHSQYLDDISHEEGQLFRDAGTEIKDCSYHGASLHCTGSEGGSVPKAETAGSLLAARNTCNYHIYTLPEHKKQEQCEGVLC